MQPLPTVRSCNTREDLANHIDEIHAGLCGFLRDVPEELLFSRAEPEGWTVAKNIQHIASTNRLMTRWINLPNWIIKLRGKPRQNQRLEELQPTNRPNLSNYGKYPEPGRVRPGAREELEKVLLTSAAGLKKAILKRPEAELDNLPGLFGKMNLRSFVLFCLKHGVHHAGVARTRLLQK
ncbi:MAG: DinB family protein [Leptospirales bacterium]|nr:DinB family protein [Leptospirales bacterium]